MFGNSMRNENMFERECDVQELASMEKLRINSDRKPQNGKIIVREKEIVIEAGNNKRNIPYEHIIGIKPELELKIFGKPSWWGVVFHIKREQDRQVSSIGCVFYGNFSKEREKFKTMTDFVRDTIHNMYTSSNIVISATGRDYKFVLYESALVIESLRETVLGPLVYPLHNLKNVSEIKALA